MKTPAVDYRELRFSRLNEPRFEHVKLLLGWIIYFAFYFLTENLIPFEKCHVIHGRLDDLIPFNEFFAIFYCYWFALLVFSLLYFILYDIKSFKHLQVFIIITQILAMIVYIVYPSVQYLRPAVMPRDNFLCRLMAFIYRFDTPSGVCPSLHVGYSMGMWSVWTKAENVSKAWKIAVVLSAIIISISTTFVKQHSVIDVLAAIPVGLIAEYVVYGKPVCKAQQRLQAYLNR